MKKLILLITGFFFFAASQVSATHLMGGQITARQISGLQYEITMDAYRDTVGIPIALFANFQIVDLFNSTIVGTTNTPYIGPTQFINRVEVYQYRDTFTFPGPGLYEISREECCRNGAIVNMSNPLGESMYFKTIVNVDLGGANSSPEFLNAPVTLAQKYSNFQYNPLPFDADGDSLAWLMEIPLTALGDTVTGYTLPHGDPTGPFTLNPQTGEITWIPDSNGHWEASFRVEEYRAGVKIGEIRRDMQIIVVDDTSNWHNVVINNTGWPVNSQGNFSFSLTPGTPFNLTVSAADLDNDVLDMLCNGEPMITSTNQAQWVIINNQPGAVSGIFSWAPDITQARMQPYILGITVNEHHNQSVYSYTQSLLLQVNQVNGIKELNKDFTFGKVYPNPSKGQLFVSFELKKSSDVTIELTDIAGKKVSEILNNKMPIGLNVVEKNDIQLSKGYYFMNIIVDGKKAASYPVSFE